MPFQCFVKIFHVSPHFFRLLFGDGPTRKPFFPHAPSPLYPPAPPYLVKNERSPREINLFILFSSITWRFNLSFIFASKKGNGVLRHFKDSYIDFTFLSKWRRKIGVHWWMAESCQGQSGVVVNFRQGNLISMSWLKFFDTIIHNNHFITFIHL